MSFNIDDSEFQRKLKALAGIPAMVEGLLDDAFEYFKHRVVDETIKGERGTAAVAKVGAKVVVGRDKGFLAGSFKVKKIKGERLMFFNISQAPHAEKINKFVKYRQKKTILQVTAFFHGDTIRKGLKEEFSNYMKAVDSGKNYVQQNPFPAV